MILLIDNYDSFVHNLARYFERLGREPMVVRNTEIDVARIRDLAPEAIVVSPGPCTPREAGCSLDIVRQLHPTIPILGICLGHQVIAEALGARIARAAEPVHGRTSRICHDGQGVFAGLPNPITAGRYHSLVVDESTLPDCLRVSAHTEDGTIMGLRHTEFPIVGLQFHPESILTEDGYGLLAAFLRQAGISVPRPLPSFASEHAPSLLK
jgi:anthranilate synthase/aminodeoxychorismate synthase-like glutamine amidotransferase